MGKTLINAYQSGSNSIKHVYLYNGEIHRETVKFRPFLATYAEKDDKTSWTDIYGTPVKVKLFDDISEMRDWKKRNCNSHILGDVSPAIQFIASKYKNDIPFSKDGLKIFNFDIETDSDKFPHPDDAEYPICAITVNEMVTNTYTTFAYKADYIPKEHNITYIKCDNEQDLLQQFITFWKKSDPQIITGWNIVSFDIPYLINRIKKILSIEDAKKLSADKTIKAKSINDNIGTHVKEINTYTIQGCIIWDYMELYKKYTQETRESYSLDNISKVELGNEKVKYHQEYDSLSELYQKDFIKFIDYNIHDTRLIYELNEKLAYIDLAITIMHKAKCQPEQIFKTVGPWDCILYNELLKRKIMCPPNNKHTKEKFIGGYVKEPIVGMHEWVLVRDIVSSYPNQVMSGNFSPETIISDDCLPPELLEIKKKYTTIERCVQIHKYDKIKPILQQFNVSFSSNGYFYDISEEGIIPAIFRKFFEQRKEYKKQEKEYKEKGMKREQRISYLFQYTMKILLNSGYGFLSNEHSRYFDLRLAEAITSNGQVCCLGAINSVIKKYPMVSCVYADTDSNFFNLSELVKARFKDKEPTKEEILNFIIKFDVSCVEPTINSFYKKLAENLNFRELTIKMEPECIADTTIFIAKKKYIMNKVWDEGEYLLDKPKRKIRGIEIVRSSTPMIVREKLREIVDIIINTKNNDILAKYVDDFKKQFYSLSIEDIAFPRSITFSDYHPQSKGLPIGVKAAFTYNRILQRMNLDEKYPLINDNDKIKFCYILKAPPLNSHVFGFINKIPIELQNTFVVDYDTQYEKAFLSPIKALLKAINWWLMDELDRSMADEFVYDD